MAKWDFNNSRYALLWNSVEGAGLIKEFLSQDMIGMNYGFWATQFSIDPDITPRGADGRANFASKMREVKPAGLMNMRAPLSDTTPRDKEGVEYYTATIPDFSADGYVETALEREQKEKMFEAYFGDDAQLLIVYANTVQKMIDDADQTLNYMSAQLLSTGSIDYNVGKGAQSFVYEAKIPASNFVKAGKAVWSDPSTRLLDQMRQIEIDAYDRWGVQMPMKWQIPYKMFHEVFMVNEQVIEQYRYYKSLNNVLLPETVVLTEEMALEAISQFEGLSPIEVIVEKQKNYNGIVHGWDEDKAVLRPQGYAGLIRHASFYDQSIYEKYGNKVIERVFSRVGTGSLYTLMNTTVPNGNLMEWHTDLFMTAVPSLDEFLYHVIVDTTQADE